MNRRAIDSEVPRVERDSAQAGPLKIDPSASNATETIDARERYRGDREGSMDIMIHRKNRNSALFRTT
jgi:hypothetical protein